MKDELVKKLEESLDMTQSKREGFTFVDVNLKSDDYAEYFKGNLNPSYVYWLLDSPLMSEFVVIDG